MADIDKCPECGEPVDVMHDNVLGERKRHRYHRCTACDWTDAPFPNTTTDDDDVEADTIPDTGEEDDIREYNQQLQDMYALGYKAGRIAGKIEALSEYATRLGKINERKQKAKRP